MGAGDGAIGALTKIVNAGSAYGKWNLVIVAEGYQAGQMAKFDRDARGFAAVLKATPPFTNFGPAINVFKLEVTSTDEGADDPAACGGPGIPKATFFDASFCNNGMRRFLLLDADAVSDAVEAALPEYDAIVALVNSTVPGGSGNGQVATCSLGAGGFDMAIHELGHAAFGLADEYSEGMGRHPAKEPAAANVTIQRKKPKVKWHSHIAPSTAVPTELNPTCSGGNAVAPQGIAGGPIGTYEGGRRFDCRVFRPSSTCKMRELGAPFCDVCQAHITKILTPFLATT
jgi:hypothetical protein